MKRYLLLLAVLIPTPAISAPLPDWSIARKTMESCYSGWNGVVAVSAGMKSEVILSSYSDENVLSIAGEQNISTSSITTDELDSGYSETSGYDLFENDRSVNADYSRDRQQNSFFVGLTLHVPLYSREIRLNRKESSDRAIEHLSDLYAQYFGHRATAAALGEEVKMLRGLMINEGHTAISAYYKMLAEIEKSKALRDSAARKITTILRGCGYVERDRIAGQGSATDKKYSSKNFGESRLRPSRPSRNRENRSTRMVPKEHRRKGGNDIRLANSERNDDDNLH